jgi:hypothetical protein
MKLAIMQPYFMPYIGYYQLIAAVDKFVVYDNIKFTKKGWINRNRMLLNGSDAVFSLPLKKDSDSLDVIKRELSSDFDRKKMLNQFRGAYERAPYFSSTYPLIEKIINNEETNLFSFLHSSILEVCCYLNIDTEILVSSQIAIDHDLKAQEKVLALCGALGADQYINTTGGVNLYSKSAFHAHGIELQFIRAKDFEYTQFGSAFVPWLSIVDILMFNSIEAVNFYIRSNYELT